MRFSAEITSSCIWIAISVDGVILHWYACGVDGRSLGRWFYGHVITKFSRMGRLLHFLTHGAPLARFARESSAIIRADKGWAVKRARPSKKVWCSGLGLCLELSLVFDFGQGWGVVCTLDSADVTELWWLDLFSCTSSSFLCAGTLSPRGKCCYFLREV